MTSAAHPKLDELVAVLARLRAPGGCAWDREQTHESLVKHLIEESFELVDAIERGTREELIEELGDVLYQVIFHADIAAHDQERPFTIDDVAARMTAKMIGRHPHVFADATAETAADVVAVWDDLKAAEKPGRTSVLDGIPERMPPLQLADKLLSRAERLGLEPPSAAPASRPEAPLTEDDLGERILALVQAGRDAGLDSERALRRAIRGLTDAIRAVETDAAPE